MVREGPSEEVTFEQRPGGREGSQLGTEERHSGCLKEPPSSSEAAASLAGRGAAEPKPSPRPSPFPTHLSPTKPRSSLLAERDFQWVPSSGFPRGIPQCPRYHLPPHWGDAEAAFREALTRCEETVSFVPLLGVGTVDRRQHLDGVPSGNGQELAQEEGTPFL